jgi:hypothetical protein
MEWPFNYHSKGRPRALFRFRLSSLAVLALFLGLLDSWAEGDSSPPVADVEDLFKGEPDPNTPTYPVQDITPSHPRELSSAVLLRSRGERELFGSVYTSLGKHPEWRTL